MCQRKASSWETLCKDCTHDSRAWRSYKHCSRWQGLWALWSAAQVDDHSLLKLDDGLRVCCLHGRAVPSFADDFGVRAVVVVWAIRRSGPLLEHAQLGQDIAADSSPLDLDRRGGGGSKRASDAKKRNEKGRNEGLHLEDVETEPKHSDSGLMTCGDWGGKLKSSLFHLTHLGRSGVFMALISPGARLSGSLPRLHAHAQGGQSLDVDCSIPAKKGLGSQPQASRSRTDAVAERWPLANDRTNVPLRP